MRGISSHQLGTRTFSHPLTPTTPTLTPTTAKMFPATLLSLAAAHPVYFWLVASLVIIVIVVVLCGLGWFLYNYVLDNLELYDPEQPFHTLVTREIMPRSLLLPRVLNFGHPVRRGTLLFWLQERIDYKWRVRCLMLSILVSSLTHCRMIRP